MLEIPWNNTFFKRTIPQVRELQGDGVSMNFMRETVKALTRSVLFDTSWRHRPKLVKQLLASRFDPNQVLGEIEFLVNRLRYKHKVITPLNGLNLVRKS